MTEFEIAVVSPSRADTEPLLLAAASAGGFPLLDFNGSYPPSGFKNLLSRLAERAWGRLGVRIGTSCMESAAVALECAAAGVDLILLSRAAAEEAGEAFAVRVQAARHLAKRIFAEVVSAEEAREALGAGVDGLVAKGNEAGGRVGSETTFVLLQRLLAQFSLPVWSWGGIGPHGAAACRAAGAQGIVLQDELALAEECSIPEPLRSRLAAMDGTETTCLGESLGRRYRFERQEGAQLIRELQEFELTSPDPRAFAQRLGEILERGDEAVLPLGQGVAFAGRLARAHGDVAGILRAYRRQMADNIRVASSAPAVAENSPFAQAHGTRYPILQGPMTRVSDVPEFADAVSQGGGLPFLALALLRRPDCERLLGETAGRLGDRPWGVGLLAFLPPELRAEQMDVVLEAKPRFAILAGGRPDQAAPLEAAGIRTYLHAPSAQLLEMFLRQGARRFIFEGRECGGHVGPLSSFVLWESALEVLIDFQQRSNHKEALDAVFAGGIHDGRSAAIVSALAASAAALGIRIGVLMGTSYLFTREAIETGAIVPLFQEEAVRCAETVVLDMGGGHAIRCAPSAYTGQFKALKGELRGQALEAEEIRRRLEEMNVGRLRIASKGVARAGSTDGSSTAPRLEQVSEARQKAEGMYMMGQVAALRGDICSIRELHQDVCRGAVERLKDFAASQEKELAGAGRGRERRVPEPIAIVGMAGFFPGARELGQYWANILARRDAIGEVPPERWPSGLFFDPNPKAPDRTVSKWGGFISPVRFNPLTYGIPPASLSSIEPVQLLLMEVTRQALADAGYDRRPFARENTAVILGFPSGILDLGQRYITRFVAELELNQVPDLDSGVRERIIGHLRRTLPELTEDSFPGILGNVAAGRLANRFDLGGPNYTVDAACATSLAALAAGIQELRHGTSDVALVGAAETGQTGFAYILFSKTGALSPRGRCRPFDAGADGIAISEGVAMLVLKRLADAERDGDRIYSVIRAMGASSDGREKSLTAPAVRGQTRAVWRAYERLEFSPAAVELVEAHGTGTVVGDRAETETLRTIFESAGARAQTCALGSVKSQIGHTKGAAGLAGLVKVALALHHRVLPPTVVEEVAPALLDRSLPLYLNTRARPWFHPASSPRRGAVSAFGFGGTNFHALLEEYGRDSSPTPDRPAELYVFRAASRGELANQLIALERRLGEAGQARAVEVAQAVAREAEKRRGECRLAMVSKDLESLRTQLAAAAGKLAKNEPFSPVEPTYLAEAPTPGPVAFLFPGQGSQYLNMLEELPLYFPRAREVFEEADAVLEGVLPNRLTEVVFPPPAYTPAEETEQSRALNQTWFAQPALGAAGYAMFTLLKDAGITPDVVAGHSYGEYVALAAAGVLSHADLIRVSEQRGRAVQETQGTGSVQMVAVQADAATLATLLSGQAGVSIAGANAPDQTIMGGQSQAMDAFLLKLDAAQIRYQKLAMSAGFHIPEAAPAAERFAGVLAGVALEAPLLQVYSNLEAGPYAAGPDAIRSILVKQLTQPLRFQDEINAIYASGVRIFVEVGPGHVLSGLVRKILGGRPAAILTTNKKGSDSACADYLKVVGWFWASGKAVRLAKLFPARQAAAPELAGLLKPEEPPKAVEWIVTGGSAKPAVQTVVAPQASAASANVKGGLPLPSKPVSQNVLGTQSLPPASGHGGNGQGRASGGLDPGLGAADRARLKPVALPSTAPVAKPVAAGAAPAVSGNGPSGNGHILQMAAAFQGTMQQFLQYQMESNRQRQELMSRFLDTERSMMEMFFGNGHHASSSAAAAFAPAAAPGPVPDVAPGFSPASMPTVPDVIPGSVAVEAALEGGATPSPACDTPPGAATGASSGPANGAAAPSAASLHETLLALISKRTGYPPEMLELDHNLEADLGIDSIKRAEIFGALLESLGMVQTDREREEYFLAISKLRTVREVLAWLAVQTASKDASPAETATAIGPVAETPAATPQPELRRFLVRVVEAPLNGSPRRSRADEVVLLTEDGSGRAGAQVAGLTELGVKVAVVRHGSESRVVAPGIYQVDLTRRESVRQLREWVGQQFGKVTTLCHLLPFDSSSAASGQLELDSLFNLATAFGPDLREKKGSLFTVTGRGGKFGLEGEKGEFRPGAAALATFLKCLAHEWPEVSMKCVDLDPAEGDEVLGHILTEFTSANPKVEIGYSSGRRFELETYESELDQQRSVGAPLDSSSVVLVTGGARGITAAIARELAARYQPTLIIAGRTAQPEPEGAATANLEGESELKRAIAAERRSRSQSVTPSAVEAEYQGIRRSREVRENLDQLMALGARVEYHSVDVRDSAAFEALIGSVYDRHRRVDGVIHGAGIVEDHLFDAKSPESFHRVFDTKVGSALVLARALRSESLRFLFFLSSLAARHGYAGGADYSAANEVLNRLARKLDREWAARVVAIGWGPWSEVGIASRYPAELLKERGVVYHSVEVGVRSFMNELRFGPKGEPEAFHFLPGEKPVLQ